ncbi:ATP-grasp domain-containing protein [Methylococcus sp. Mc7]|uniref:ATP-grasp domain-containing protein n=1 Tax=Methylococcus sp. Mc7 TaxID=2860258 RepID=UPI001C52CDAB|nr:ATP-grasp domain-containing protein [Methylococcus sp. Mc7]QXP85541.1 ATP-grasp domain-containing protein [Methylococcus sp. Mc7]
MQEAGSALVVAASASTLGRSLKRGGWTPFAIDGFGDLDTREHCRECRVVPLGKSGFDASALRSAIERMEPTDVAFYGGGLDSLPGVIECLARGRVLAGNAPETVRLAKTPRLFFPLLSSLGISFPETRFDAPRDVRGWLVKHGGSEGGGAVNFARDTEISRPDGYFQRRLETPPMSALFLADGAESRIIGFNTLWTSAADPHLPFRFAGAINRTSLAAFQREAVRGIVAGLVPALRLRGLNSLDFMTDEDGGIRVLELNPRPSATMALYDDEFPSGLAGLHIRACLEGLPEFALPAFPARAFRIIYAPHDVEPPGTLEWPVWCRDRPSPGCSIEKGAPLCTITAEGADESEVLLSLAARKTSLMRTMTAAGELAATCAPGTRPARDP